MELLEDIRFFEKTNRFPIDCFREAVLQNDLFENVLNEDNELVNSPERVDVLNKINNDIYVRNDYKNFCEELTRNKRSCFLTPYTPAEFIKHNVQTYQVKGYEIGFALKPMTNGDVDIISVHNNTNIGGIGDALIDSAIRLGGTVLDHFDGYLSEFYKNKGFQETERSKWNQDYAPENWDYEKYGTPDVITRKLRK